MKEQDIKYKNFKKELKDLLNRYNASIEFGCSDCSDLHGVYDAKMVVHFNQERTEHILSSGYDVGQYDLED
jgi:hypothetical protein